MLIKGKKITTDNPVLGVVGISAPDAVWYPDFYAKGKKELEKRGIKIVEGDTVKTDYFYLAEKPQIIAEGLHEMFSRQDIDAIMCAGGGMNMNKVLPFLDFDLISKNFKPFIGISNIVVLMTAMLQYNMVSFHGPFVVWSYGLDNTPTDYTHRNWIKALQGYTGELSSVSQWKVFHSGETEGGLIGGNITSLGTIIGTKYCPVELFKGKILILEDIDEKFNVLDSVLTNMDLLGIFKQINGVIVGKLNDCVAPEYVDMKITNFLEMVFGQYDFPVIYDCDFGHVPDNLCLPIGCRVKMIAQEEPKIILLEPGVK